MAAPTVAVVDRDGDLRQQVEQVHQRDGRDDGGRQAGQPGRVPRRVRRRPGHRPPPRGAEDGGVGGKQAAAEPREASEQPLRAGRRALERKARRAAHRRQRAAAAARAGPAPSLGGREHGNRAALHERHEQRAAEQHHDHGDEECGERQRDGPAAPPPRPAPRGAGPARNSSRGSRPEVSTTSAAPPTAGTASSAVNTASATNCTRTTCQFAAVMRAPRFSASLRRGDERHQSGTRPLYHPGSVGSITGIIRARHILPDLQGSPRCGLSARGSACKNEQTT